jgi:hypothetical protein
MKLISTLFLALSMLAATAPAAENANDLFQQALVKERTEGNLPEAIKLYQRIVDKYEGGTPLKLDLSVPKMASFALHPDNRRFAFSVNEGSKSEL